MAIVLPGPDENTQGYWPGAWTMVSIALCLYTPLDAYNAQGKSRATGLRGNHRRHVALLVSTPILNFATKTMAVAAGCGRERSKQNMRLYNMFLFVPGHSPRIYST